MKTGEICRWEHFSHDADIGIRGFGDTLEAAFSQAAMAMTAVICDVDLVKPLVPVEIRCEAPDYELLFVDWLNALVYAMAVEHMLFSRFDIRIDNMQLHAAIRGEAVDRLRHQPAVEVKGATYTALKVGQEQNGRWVAQCVIDV
ncbi:MAG TPA: archease [Gammaproteobacteria bacterium]|nr:archease [Gammaproteobacteria bacterium]